LPYRPLWQATANVLRRRQGDPSVCRLAVIVVVDWHGHHIRPGLLQSTSECCQRLQVLSQGVGSSLQRHNATILSLERRRDGGWSLKKRNPRQSWWEAELARKVRSVVAIAAGTPEQRRGPIPRRATNAAAVCGSVSSAPATTSGTRTGLGNRARLSRAAKLIRSGSRSG
jgi:hypothetical protein